MLRASVARQSHMNTRSKSTIVPGTRPAARGRLPVPPLRQTLDKYLASLEPFFNEDEIRGGMTYESARALREKWVKEFESGIGQTLQERLLALDKVSPHNWLDDNFWVNKAYLEWRAPLLVNSNWWLAFYDDPLIPRSALSGETNNNRAGTTFWQLRRAAWLLHRILQFKENMAQESQTHNLTASASWMAENTARLFCIGRIPELLCDTLSKPQSASSRSSRSIHLMIHGWCYSLVVYHSPSGSHSPLTLLSPGEIEARLRAVVLDVEVRLANGEKALPVGVLSADERDRWAENLEYLLNLSPTNRQSHQAMLHSVMGLSLDHTTYTIPPPSWFVSNLSENHVHPRSPTQSALDSHLQAIRGTPQNVANRFFDKAFTLIVDPSTRAGASGEHSPVDALVPSIIAEYGLGQGVDAEAFEHKAIEVDDIDGRGWERLDWVGDAKMWKECEAATSRANKVMNDSDTSVLVFDKYGTESIRNYKLSPDAYIQMALQLAWYRTRGEFTATYETVLTRMFKRGRTETLRTYSQESRLWVLSMINPKATPSERLRLLHKALVSHTRRTREAMTGRGFDRHLLGLRLLLRPLNGESAGLLEDELFERSARWKLSTSGLSAGLLFKGTGFGAAYDDGYGINYLAAPDGIKFGIESKFPNPLTSTSAFKHAITAALVDMQGLCEAEMPAETQVASHL